MLSEFTYKYVLLNVLPITAKFEFARQKFGKDKGFQFTKLYRFRCAGPNCLQFFSLSLAQKSTMVAQEKYCVTWFESLGRFRMVPDLRDNHKHQLSI